MARPPAIDWDEFLAQVQEIQLEPDMPLGPTLARLNHISLAQAYYYLKAARDKGLLVDLQHVPVTATIMRNTPSEHSWQVCRTCLATWPCQVVEHRYSGDPGSPS